MSPRGRAQPTQGSSNLKVRVGVLSTARINALILRAARASQHVEVLGIASRERARAEAFARENSIERAYGSYDALLEDPVFEAVYISLPNKLHVEWCERALAAGKHVLCEKPLTRSRDEAERAFDAAERASRVLAEAFMYRHHPQTLRLKELIDEGVIGAVRLIRSSHSFTIDHPNDARLLTAMEGGSLMDVGCYCVNFSRFLAGEPERVYAEQAVNHEGVDLRFGGTMRFPGDVLAQFDSGLDVPDRKQVEVVGEEGSIDVNDPWHCQEPLLKLRRRGEIERIVSEPLDAYRLELEDFAAAVRGERVPRLGRKDAVAQAAAIEALYRSADRGEPVELFGTRLGEG